jgi:FKBP-type peptidyl-prolyl cis-trans isomerase 2
MIDIGRKVRVHCVGRLDDGSEFDNSYKNGRPLEFIVGSHQVIPGLDKAVSEMKVGEKRKVRVSAAMAYGAYNEDLVETVPVKDFPHAERLPIGDAIVLSTSEGQMRVKVLKIEDGLVFFDHNHELAGKDLDFDIEVVEVLGLSGSNIENERYLSGTCGCGCDELREYLGAGSEDCTHEHTHAHTHAHGHAHDHGHAHEHAHTHAHEPVTSTPSSPG